MFRRRPRALTFESLEDRTLLAASNLPSIYVENSILNIRGTLGNDVIEVEAVNQRDSDDGYRINFNGQQSTISGQVNGIKVLGLAGDDQITVTAAGGRGVNVSGGLGNDTIRCGITLFEDDARNMLFGDAGDDTITGGPRVNLIDGGLGNDTIDGGTRNDILHGGKGDDIIRGGTGNDELFGDAGNDQLEGGDHADEVHGGAGNDTLLAFDFDNLFGEAGNDVLDARGAPLGCYLVGGAGNDTLYGSPDTDYVEGGAGNDLIVGGGGNDTIYGQAGIDEVDGGSGNDRVYAGAGNDLVQGGDGMDWLFGEAGNDRLFGGGAADEVDGGKGKDNLHGGDGDDQLTGGAGRDTLDGDSGNNLLDSLDKSDLRINGLTANLHNELIASINDAGWPNRTYGYATYDLQNIGGQLTATLKIDFGYPYYPHYAFDFYIDGIFLAHAVTDDNSSIQLEFSSDPSSAASPFPADFPELRPGVVITVGGGIRGTFNEEFFV